jgi:hypothetical protein
MEVYACAGTLAEELANALVGDVFELREDARERHGEGPPVAERPHHHSGPLCVCVCVCEGVGCVFLCVCVRIHNT